LGRIADPTYCTRFCRYFAAARHLIDDEILKTVKFVPMPITDNR
jgi:hypothetical protein